MATFQNPVSLAPPPTSQQPAASPPGGSRKLVPLPLSASQQPVPLPTKVSQQQAALPQSVTQQQTALHPKPSPPPYTALPKPKLGNDSDVFDQHPVHWYPDGDILLQIGRVRFKVVRGFLKIFSTWFRRAIHQINCLDIACAYLQAAEAGTPAPVVLVKVANVDGVPLLYIDAAKTTAVPSAQEFALLLDALYLGIQFTYIPLSLNEVISLYKAATYYCFPHVITFVKKQIEGFFPSDFSSLDQQPVANLPEVALVIGTKYGINSIRKRAYYDLARAPVTQWRLIASSQVRFVIPVLSGVCSSGKSTAVTLQGDPLTNACLHRVNALQKHLTLTWSKILVDLQSLTCLASGGDDCLLKNRYVLLERAVAVMSKHPYDPLHGVRLLAVDDGIIQVICNGAQASVKKLMENTEALIMQALERDWIALD